jgi:hypothetical protein
MEGYVTCPYCGGETPSENFNCIYCGNPIPRSLGVFSGMRYGGKGIFFLIVAAAVLLGFLLWVIL